MYIAADATAATTVHSKIIASRSFARDRIPYEPSSLRCAQLSAEETELRELFCSFTLEFFSNAYFGVSMMLLVRGLKSSQSAEKGLLVASSGLVGLLNDGLAAAY